MKTNIIANISNMKSIYTYLAIVLMVLGLSLAQTARAAGYIYEAVGIYGTSYTTNNTWTSTGTVNTGSACATTALSSNLEVTLSGGYIGTNAMTVYGKTNLKVKVTTGKIYRIVFSPANGNSSPNDAAHHFTCNGTGSISNNTWTSTGDGNSSVTFTGLDADDNFKITHINVYIKSSASDAQASLTPSSVTMSAGDADTYNFKLTTNLGITFDGANSPYQNQVETDASSSDIELCAKYDTYGYCQSYFTNTEYKNNSNIPVSIFAYNAGTYNADIFLGYQTGSNNDHSYYMKGIEVPFTVIVEDDCTETKVDWNAVSPSLTLSAIPCTTTSFTRTATAKLNAAPNTPTEQAIAYSSSNEEVAEVSSAGVVTINGVGNATIKATANSDGTYCKSENTYDITVTGFTVTLHYPSCAAAVGSTLTGTSKSFSNVCGAFSLDYNMAVEGYEFCGWTTNGSFADGDAAPTPLYTGSSVDITNNTNLYAVYQKHSNTFNKVPKNTTLTEGDYVFSSSYDAGSKAQVMTNTLDGNNRMVVDGSSYTFTEAGLTCTNDNYIWHLTPTGNSNEFTVYNAASEKYLGANNGSTSNSDRQMRLEESVSGNYQKWHIAQSGVNTVPYQVKNVGRDAIVGVSGTGTKYIGYFNSTTTLYLFKRTAVTNAYTISPSCNAAEYTVTIQQQEGGSVVATATGTERVWSDPVLSGLHGSETVTITATPAPGYEFTSWTVVSGGATLSPNTTTSPATFTMPTANVVIRPNFSAQTYTITYKDKDNAAFSGSPAEPTPATYTYGVGATLPEVTKSGYVFMGWFAETDCSGTRVNSISTSDYGDKTFYALFMLLSDFRAWCPEPEVHLTGDNVYITSTKDKSVKAVNTLTLNARNLVPGSTVRLSSPASSGIMFSASGVKYNATTATIDFTADGGGDITDVPVYVHYYPTSAGTGAPADITVKAEYQTNTDYYSTKDVHVRNMPSSFVIATKVGSTWYALPANIASASNPEGVLVEVNESSWTAMGPSTLAYELWPVKSTTSTGDLYASRGEKLRFSGNSNKGLYGSKTANTVNNSAAISAIGSDPTDGDQGSYEWAVTTTAVGSTWKYVLEAGTGKDLVLHKGDKMVWGTYGDFVTNEVYLLPLTEITPFTMKVVEWYPTKVLVYSPNDLKTIAPAVSINGTPVASPTYTGKGTNLYEIGNLSLESNPSKTLTLSYTAAAVDYATSVTIPIIISRVTKSVADPTGALVAGLRPLNEPFASLTTAVYNYTDLVVRDGAVLTLNGTKAQNTFFDVTIYPTSKISVPTTNANNQDNYLGVHSLTFFGGIDEIYNGSGYTINKYGVPELSLKGKCDHKTVTTINYDMRVDDSQMYSLTVPYDVNLADITWWDGSSMGTLGDKLWVSAYDGQARANKDMAHTWVYEVNFESKFGEAKLKQGTGYTISADKQSGFGDGAGGGYSIIRLPMRSNFSGTAPNNVEAAKTVAVTAYVNTQGVTVGDNNKGWNLVGNPYMASIGGGGADDASRLVVGYLRETGTGPWEWVNDTYRYVTIPNDNGTDYYQAKFSQVTLPPFKNFFVQVGNTGSMSFDLASRHDAPNRYLQVQNREVEVDIILANDSRQDNMGLLIAEQYSPAYEINADLEKMIGSMAVYTIFGGYNLAYNALSPDDAKQFIPIGYVAPSAGEYTFSLDEESDLNEVDHIYLTDYQENVTVDLMEKNYSFTTVSGKNESRFALNATLKDEPETPTDIDIINSGGDLNADAPQKFIYHDKMFIYHRGVIYDATGKRVKEINK